MKTHNVIIILTLSLLLVSSCTTITPHDYAPTKSISKEEYSRSKTTKGVVLLSVSWNRSWNCGGFENAELRSIGFDFVDNKYIGDDHRPDLVLNGSPGRYKFVTYVYMLKPGKYAISNIKIKVSKSVSDVGYLITKRSDLISKNNIKGGTFDISAGETVYIGHFDLDCAYLPMIWRYYKKDKKEFIKYIAKVKQNFPYIDLSNVQYRLFKTKVFGYDFDLQSP